MSFPRRLNLGIRGRLFALVAVFAIGCAALAGALIQLQAQNAYDARMRSLKQLVAAAHGVLAAHKDLADKGVMKTDEAKKRALEVIRPMWFGKADYFTARSIEGISLLNPAAPEKEGQNRDTASDSRGKHYSRMMTEMARSPGEGFVTYYTINPDTKVDSEKTTYIKTYAPWGIAIAAGVFTDDLAAETRSSMIQAGGITFLLVLALSCVALWQARSIVGPLSRLQSAMLDIANGRDAMAQLDTGRHDEIGEMARAVQVFRDNTQRARELEHQSAAARSEADGERSRSESERAAVAQQTDEVVHLLGDGLARLSDGDLTIRLARFPAGYEKLENDFNGAVAKLEVAMKSISVTGSAIGSGASEISNASDDLSRRTEQQAASLEQTAAALEEITATVKKTAEGARFASQKVSGTRSEAEQSGRIVRDAVDAMSGIERSSSEITQIIGVIDEIAFQTNLLALNAGVEAARAGEAGKGFAVVASEVRALAQRSAEAAKQIKALISTSTAQVASGVSLVGETGEALSRIVKQVSEIAVVVTEIAGSAQEQSIGLDEVNTAVSQMDQITQENAAMVEQATAASHTLRQEAQQLNELMSRFRTSATQAAVAPARKVAAQPKPAVRMAASSSRGSSLARKPAPDSESWNEF